MAAGTVTQVAYPSTGHGANPAVPVTVWIDHGGGWTSLMTHLANTTVTVGSPVTRSTNVGHPSCYSESGGSATGRHVHFGLYHNGSNGGIYDTLICGYSVTTEPRISRDGATVDVGETASNTNCPSPGAQPVLAVLESDGDFIVKQGGLTAEWVFLRGQTKAIAVDGANIVALADDGTILGKEGIQGEWVTLEGGAASIAAGGNRVAFISNSGSVSVKEGLFGGWTYGIIGNAKQVALAGNRIAVVLNNGLVYAKDGIFGQWVLLTGEGRQVALDGDRIAVVKSDSSLMVKDGMFGGWVFVVGGTRSVALGGNMVAATQHNNELIIKIGTYGGWGFHSGQVCHTALASNWLGTLREDTGVVAKDLNQGEWIFETGGVKQIAVSKDGNASTSDLDDFDCDDSFNDADNCPAMHNPDQLNTDVAVNPPGDAQGDVCDDNDDDDACTDGEEGGLSEPLGGDRNPLDPWDFYDVTGDGNIDLSDTLEILDHFGHGPNDDASDNALDRAITDALKPWRTSESDDGVDLTDALNNLASFGHSCA